MDHELKRREDELRRLAALIDLKIVKSRHREGKAAKYALLDAITGEPVVGDECDATLQEVSDVISRRAMYVIEKMPLYQRLKAKYPD